MGRPALKNDNRRAVRLGVHFAAGLREPGYANRFDVHVRDLSVSGFRCETRFLLYPGNSVFVKIPSLGALEAKVVRRDGDTYGCAFDRPLHSAVLDHIVAMHRKVQPRLK